MPFAYFFTESEGFVGVKKVTVNLLTHYTLVHFAVLEHNLEEWQVSLNCTDSFSGYLVAGVRGRHSADTGRDTHHRTRLGCLRHI